MAIPRTKLDRLLSVDFQDPFMSHQFAIQSVTIAKASSQFASWFPGRFFQERTEAVDLPFKTIAADSRHVQATNRYYAGYGSFNSFNGTFFEKSDCSTMKAFVKWQSLIVNENGEYRPADQYQARMVLNLLQDKNNGGPVASVEFLGVFPTQITTISLTGAEITRVALQVSFSVNEVNWIF